MLLDTLEHTELVSFVKKYLRKNTIYKKLYYLGLLVFFTMLTYGCVQYHHSGLLKFPEILSQVSFGIIVTLGLIPVHEIIHALAYKFFGAKQTSFDADWKKFTFMAVADKFVANKKELTVVALAPFTLISSALLIGLLFTTPQTTIMLLTALLTHATICSGDFSLCGYFAFYKNKTIVTYDNKAQKISYFYEKCSATL